MINNVLTAVSLLLIGAAVLAILRRADPRLTLLLTALALGVTADARAYLEPPHPAGWRHTASIVQTFLGYFTREQFLLPIGCCMGFAHVLRHTGCDQHLVHLLIAPLRRVRTFLVPGVVLVSVLVNVPVISQASTLAAVGPVLLPILRAAHISPVTAGASLVLGASVGGELLNPGAPELRTISDATGGRSGDVVVHALPLLAVHLSVSLPLFWFLCHRAERERRESSAAEGGAASRAAPGNASPALPGAQEAIQQSRQTVSPTLPAAPDLPGAPSAPQGGATEAASPAFRVNPLKAVVPLVPLVLLFCTALPPPLRLAKVPERWLVPTPAGGASYDSRLVGAAMLVGVVVAGLASPRKAGGVMQAFFVGAGHAFTNIIAPIIAAGCFGKGIEAAGLAHDLQGVIARAPGLLVPAASGLPLAFAWLSGSGMAATQSLYRFFVAPAQAQGVDPLRLGAVVSLSAASGRTMSPVAAVVLAGASLSHAEPLAIVRRVALPLLAGVAAVVVFTMLCG